MQTFGEKPRIEAITQPQEAVTRPSLPEGQLSLLYILIIGFRRFTACVTVTSDVESAAIDTTGLEGCKRSMLGFNSQSRRKSIFTTFVNAVIIAADPPIGDRKSKARRIVSTAEGFATGILSVLAESNGGVNLQQTEAGADDKFFKVIQTILYPTVRESAEKKGTPSDSKVIDWFSKQSKKYNAYKQAFTVYQGELLEGEYLKAIGSGNQLLVFNEVRCDPDGRTTDTKSSWAIHLRHLNDLKGPAAFSISYVKERHMETEMQTPPSEFNSRVVRDYEVVVWKEKTYVLDCGSFPYLFKYLFNRKEAEKDMKKEILRRVATKQTMVFLPLWYVNSEAFSNGGRTLHVTVTVTLSEEKCDFVFKRKEDVVGNKSYSRLEKLLHTNVRNVRGNNRDVRAVQQTGKKPDKTAAVGIPIIEFAFIEDLKAYVEQLPNVGVLEFTFSTISQRRVEGTLTTTITASTTRPLREKLIANDFVKMYPMYIHLTHQIHPESQTHGNTGHVFGF